MDITKSINNSRSTDISDINDIAVRWQTYKSPKDAKSLYDALKPTISSAIKSYAGGDSNMSVPAYRIAFDAIKTYDKSKGTDVRTHVYNNLKRLNRISSERSNIVHIPEGVSRDYSVISKAIADFSDRYNREPNDDELSDITKLSKKRIDKILQRGTQISGSESVTDEGADRVTHTGISEDTYIDYVYSSSDNIDKKIIEMMSGRKGSRVYTGAEVARRLRMTPAAVSLRISKLRDKMAEVKALV